MVGLIGMLSLVVCTGAVALGFVLRPEPEIAALIDFDELDFPLPEIIALQEGEPEAAPVAPRPRTPAPQVRPQPAPSGADRFVQGGGTPGDDPAASAGDLRGEPTGERVAIAPRPRVSDDPADPTRRSVGSAGRSAPLDLSVGGSKIRRDSALVLSGPRAIRDMIGEEMRGGIPGLVNCYNRRLKQVPDLRGRWRLTFTVTPSGSASNAKATPLDRGDADLESCLASHVEDKWSFGRISVASPVAKTLTFKAAM